MPDYRLTEKPEFRENGCMEIRIAGKTEHWYTEQMEVRLFGGRHRSGSRVCLARRFSKARSAREGSALIPARIPAPQSPYPDAPPNSLRPSSSSLLNTMPQREEHNPNGLRNATRAASTQAMMQHIIVEAV